MTKRKKRKKNGKKIETVLIAIALIAFLCYTNVDAMKKIAGNYTEVFKGKTAEDGAADNPLQPKGKAADEAQQGKQLPKNPNGSRQETDESNTQDVQPKKKGNKRKIEMPAALQGVPERIIEHTAYTVSFNREHNNPNYVAWELTAEETTGTLSRSNNFMPDPDVPAPHQVTTNDYKGSGYDRGHMAPAADMKWSVQAMNECFYMSNMCPQNHTLNAGGWEKLEEACRRWAQQEGAVYIVCGPVYKSKKHKTIGREHIVTVPEGFFKVVLSMKKGEEKAIGFYYANNDKRQTMEQTAMSVDEVEMMTGMNFFVNVPKRIEERVEASFSLKDWR